MSRDSVLDVVEENCILLGEVGSTAHGVSVGTDDRDQMGVFVEPPKYVCGMSSLDHKIHRVGKDGKLKGDGERSGPGDLDLVYYSLRKYCRLASQGNPSVLVLLWLPFYYYRCIDELGAELVALRNAFVCLEAGRRFLGYLVGQRKALTGERNKKVSRPELVERYGYDTKFAGHALRLGIQGYEYLGTGSLTIPMREVDRELVLAVRRGELSYEQALGEISAVEEELERLLERNPLGLPERSDRDRVNKWLVEAHLGRYGLSDNA